MNQMKLTLTAITFVALVCTSLAQTNAEIIEMLQSKDVSVKMSALVKIDQSESPSPDYIPALVSIITSEEGGRDMKSKALSISLKMKATAVLSKTGAPAVPEVKKLMHSDDTRWTAVEILQRMGAPAIEALPELISALHDKNKSIRYLAAKTIMQLGPDAKNAVPDLTVLVNDKHDSAREFAIKALGEMGKYGESALPALRKATKHKDFLTRTLAEEAIKKIESAISSE